MSDDEKIISFRIPEKVHDAFNNKVPWGVRSYVVEALLRSAIRLFSTKRGRKVLADLVVNKFSNLDEEVENALTEETSEPTD